MYRGKYFPIRDFSGGYCGNLTATSLKTNQAADLDNIVIRPNGAGFRMRRGNVSLTSTTAINSGASITAAGFYYLSPTLEYVVIISGTKFMHRGNNATSFTDATGSATVGGYVDFFNFKGKLIGIGGQTVPFEWDTSTNVSVLTGSPPSASGGFTNNNRVFAYNTSTNPSTIYWTIIGSENDWTGAGSGNATAGALDDQTGIIGHAILSTNYILLFTSTSTFQMVTTQAPFPIFSLFKSTGCVGHKAIVSVNNQVYWVNQHKRMVSTDGENIQEYPTSADDLWNSVQDSQLSNIVGWRQTGSDYDWVVWSVSTSGSSNNRSIIWDLRNNCWLRCTTGHNANAVAKTSGTSVTATMQRDGVYIATTSGFVYAQDQSGVYYDDSNTSTAISSYWQWGWLNPSVLDEMTQINRFTAEMTAQSAGSITLSYGFDFIPSFSTTTLSQVQATTEQIVLKSASVLGRGNASRFKLSYTSTGLIPWVVNSVTLRGKTFGQRKL